MKAIMATKTYSRTTITGETRHSRKEEQGRPVTGQRKVKFSARVSDSTKARVKAEAKKYNMTSSYYADIALSLFRINSVGQELVKP